MLETIPMEQRESGMYEIFTWLVSSIGFIQATGKTLQPNLFSPYLRDGQFSENDEAELVWAAYSVLAGGLDTVLRP